MDRKRPGQPRFLSTPPSLAPTAPRFHIARGDAPLLLALMVAAGTASLLLGQDANWDLQNYHFYIAWAWWHGRTFTQDIAAAQVQTFHNPLLDLPFYAMVAAQWPPRLISFLLAIPAAFTAFFAYKLVLLLFRDLPRRRCEVAVACSLAVGMTSAMGIGALGNTMNEWPLAALIMLALWMIASAAVGFGDGALCRRVLLLAGAIVGVACGAKLSAATFAVGLCAALLFRGPYSSRYLRIRFTEAAWFALGVLAGMAATLGPWAYTLWTHFGNPIFPYANQWFRSPWWAHAAVPMPHPYGPQSVGDWASFPFELLGSRLNAVAEVDYRDGRFPLVYALALAAAVVRLVQRPKRHQVWSFATPIGAAWRIVGLFVIVSFVIWTGVFSIYRYLLPLDVLTGALIVGLLLALFPARLAMYAAAVAAIALVATTRYADWGHVAFGDRWFEIRVPPVEQGALVLITTGEGVSYFLPFLPPESRFVAGRNTAILDPSAATLLADRVREVVREHRGPLYQLTYPLTEGTDVLALHGLARWTASCAVVVTNMPTSPLELCRLVRDPGPR